jgi:hypothetical protein
VEANIVDILTVGGPVAAIAILSIWFNHKLVTVWTTQVQETYTELNKTLGEVTEALRHINGK